MDRQLRIRIIIAIACMTGFIVLLVFSGIGSKNETEGNYIEDNSIEDNSTEDDMQEYMDRMEAYRLFAALFRENAIAEDDRTEEEWFEYYQHVLLDKKIMDIRITGVKDEALEYREFVELYYRASKNLDVDYDALVSKLPDNLRYAGEREKVRAVDFLLMYESLLQSMDIYPCTITAFHAEDNILYDINGNEYVWENVKDYSDLNMYPEQAVAKDEYGGRTYAEAGEYLLTVMEAISYKGNIIYIKKCGSNSFVLPNVWLVKAQGNELEIFNNGIRSSFHTDKEFKEELASVIADIYIENGGIKQIVVKQTVISGKVLISDSEGIELEGFGRISFDENCRIYKIYDDLEMEKSTAVLVGYSVTDLVVSENKICAVLIKEALRADKIRVILNQTGYAGLYHDKIEITSDLEYYVEDESGLRVCNAGEITRLSYPMEDGQGKRVMVKTSSEKARLKLLSVKRSYGIPEYRGIFDICETDRGLTIVNELSLEEYLYSVVPSEMPSSYGNQALMAQAVCARSYAYNQIISNRYGSLGAHVDDSVNCQVYNNIRESKEARSAVKDTYGKIMKYGDRVVSSYYFSTSCGMTASVEDVWRDAAPESYFTGNSQSMDREVQKSDLSKEEKFREFIDGAPSTYDSESGWYRWSIAFSEKALEECINGQLEADGIYGVDSIGRLKDIRVLKRASSGIITELELSGSRADVKISGQGSIRSVLSPGQTKVKKQDGNSVTMSMLPSAFFYIEKTENDGETEYCLKGGGYGHGVGMSQNGANRMSGLGFTFEEILKHYYPGISLDFLYV